MNKQELIARIAEHDVFTSKTAAAEVLDIITATIAEEITAGNEVYLGQNFGGFKAGTQAARSGVSALNGEAYDTPEKQVIKFKPSTKLKAAVAK